MCHYEGRGYLFRVEWGSWLECKVYFNNEMKIKNAFEMRSMFYRQYQSIHNFDEVDTMINLGDLIFTEVNGLGKCKISRNEKYRIKHSIFDFGPWFGPERWCRLEPVGWGPGPLEGQFFYIICLKQKRLIKRIHFFEMHAFSGI